MSNITRDIMNAPLAEMVEKLGMGVADAQYELDQNAIKLAQLMAGFKENQNGELVKDDSTLVTIQEGQPKVSLISLGFAPTFYQFSETYLEMKMSFSMSESKEIGGSVTGKVRAFMFSASVSASFAQKYQYSAEGSSSIRTKLVSVPSPAVFEERLKQLVEDNE